MKASNQITLELIMKERKSSLSTALFMGQYNIGETNSLILEYELQLWQARVDLPTICKYDHKAHRVLFGDDGVLQC